jgi:diaminopimelate epimerase
MTPPQNKLISFVKASACGNDFLVIDGGQASGDLSSLTRRLCDRHNGVGADGVEWLFPDDEADVAARLINTDGSEAEISGNGTRCVAAELCARTGKSEIVVRTGAGLKTCRLVERRSHTYEFEADMGAAKVGAPFAIETMWLRAVGTPVSTGNPHFVVLVDSFPDDWQRQAALIQTQPQFPHGTNVEYVVARRRDEIEIRLFERGVGETQSSGTGSCASAVAAIASGKAASPVTVIAPGGPQIVRSDDHWHLSLRGPATIVCRGEFFI